MLHYRDGADAARGGMDLIVSLTAEQRAVLGPDAADLAEAFDSLLNGVASLRTGEQNERTSLKDGRTDQGWYEWLIADLQTLRAKIDAVESAAIRRHAGEGGSYGELARAMNVSRATAQGGRDRVMATDPSEVEQWVTTPAAPIEGATTTDPVVRRLREQKISNVNVNTGNSPVQAHTIHGNINL